MKITDIRSRNLRVVKEVGELEPAWSVGTMSQFRIGGGAFVEIQTDQGITGIGQAVNLYRTFGKTFSSGGLAFQGGDSTGLIERRLIEKLLEQGKAI